VNVKMKSHLVSVEPADMSEVLIQLVLVTEGEPVAVDAAGT